MLDQYHSGHSFPLRPQATSLQCSNKECMESEVSQLHLRVGHFLEAIHCRSCQTVEQSVPASTSLFSPHFGFRLVREQAKQKVGFYRRANHFVELELDQQRASLPAH